MKNVFILGLKTWLQQTSKIVLISLLWVSHAQAAEIEAGSEALVAKLQSLLPQVGITRTYAAEVAGFYYVELDNGQSLFGSKDAKFLFSGDLFSIDRDLVNLSEARRTQQRQVLMAAEPVENMLVFKADGETKTHINVFTDVDCGYCRKLHQEMADINKLGIEVRYLAYPRQGLGTETHKRIESAWCAENPNEALTTLKQGGQIPSKQCDNPIAGQYELGQQVGVTGTPAIVTADGRLLPGYMPAEALAQALGLSG